MSLSSRRLNHFLLSLTLSLSLTQSPLHADHEKLDQVRCSFFLHNKLFDKSKILFYNSGKFIPVQTFETGVHVSVISPLNGGGGRVMQHSLTNTVEQRSTKTRFQFQNINSLPIFVCPCFSNSRLIPSLSMFLENFHFLKNSFHQVHVTFLKVPISTIYKCKHLSHFVVLFENTHHNAGVYSLYLSHVRITFVTSCNMTQRVSTTVRHFTCAWHRVCLFCK